MTFINTKNCTIEISGEIYEAKNFKVELNGKTYASGSAELFEALKQIAHTNAEAEAAFNACVIQESYWNHAFNQTAYRMKCVKHLWSVEGPDREDVRRQALHYLQQYWADGEYGDILYKSIDNEES
jgi:hypothetical protein